MQNHTHFPYRVRVFFNKVKTPKKMYPFKTIKAARKFLRGVSTHELFKTGAIYHVEPNGDLVPVEAEVAEG